MSFLSPLQHAFCKSVLRLLGSADVSACQRLLFSNIDLLCIFFKVFYTHFVDKSVTYKLLSLIMVHKFFIQKEM